MEPSEELLLLFAVSAMLVSHSLRSLRSPHGEWWYGVRGVSAEPLSGGMAVRWPIRRGVPLNGPGFPPLSGLEQIVWLVWHSWPLNGLKIGRLASNSPTYMLRILPW